MEIYFISLDTTASNFTIYVVNYFTFAARQYFINATTMVTKTIEPQGFPCGSFYITLIQLQI